jgi:hypothetical protein
MMRKNYSHIHIHRYEMKHKQQQNHKHQCDNGVQQYCLRLHTFVSVGEAFLFLFKDLK